MYGQFDLNERLEQIKAGAKIEGKVEYLLHLLLLPKQLSKQSLNLISQLKYETVKMENPTRRWKIVSVIARNKQIKEHFVQITAIFRPKGHKK